MDRNKKMIILYRTKFYARSAFLAICFMFIGANVGMMAQSGARPWDQGLNLPSWHTDTIQKVAGAEARIQAMALDITEMRQQIRELSAELNMGRGIGIAFLGALTFFQIVGFVSDRGLKRAAQSPRR